jgi:hypothetical protein
VKRDALVKHAKRGIFGHDLASPALAAVDHDAAVINIE